MRQGRFEIGYMLPSGICPVNRTEDRTLAYVFARLIHGQEGHEGQKVYACDCRAEPGSLNASVWDGSSWENVSLPEPVNFQI